MMNEKLRRALILGIPLIWVAALAGCGQAKFAAKKSMEDSTVTMSDGVAVESPASVNATRSPMAASFQRGDDTGRAPMVATPHAQERQVIRKADLDIRVDNVEKAEKAVSAIVQAAGGYTESASSSDLASTHPVLKLALRVPVGAFDSSIAKFETLGVRLSKTIGSEDVTGQLVDLDARLKTLRSKEEVIRDMLKNRTQLDDVFSIQNQLTEIRTQIETIGGERKSQAGLAALSTIGLTLEQNAVANLPSTDPNWLAQTWAEASSGASVAFRIFVVGFVWVLAFSPFWIPALLILRRTVKPVLDKKTVAPM